MDEIYRICRHKAVVCIVASYAHVNPHIVNPHYKQLFNERSPRYWTKHTGMMLDNDEFLFSHTDKMVTAGGARLCQSLERLKLGETVEEPAVTTQSDITIRVPFVLPNVKQTTVILSPVTFSLDNGPFFPSFDQARRKKSMTAKCHASSYVIPCSSNTFITTNIASSVLGKPA